MAEKSQDLARYVQDCETLRHDISALINDLRFQETAGVVRYAVDFSEIFSYTFPYQPVDYMRAFYDDDEETLRAAQHNALEVLFHELPAKPILIAPYALELRGFVATWPYRHLEEAAAIAAEAFAQARELDRDEEYAHLRDVVAQHKRDLWSWQRTIAEIARFFESKGAKLLKLMEDLDLDPMQRLTALLETGPFESLSAVISEPLEVDQHVVDRWQTGLVEARGTGRTTSCYLDAIAVATVKAANQHMQASRTRLRLVTKSRTMRELLHKEIEAGLWEESQACILAHPRSFAALCAFAPGHARAALPSLEDLEKSLALFLESYRELDPDQPDLPEKTKKLEEGRASDIKAQWRAVTSLSVVGMGALDQKLAQETSGGARGQILRILQFVRDDKALTEFVKRRVDELRDAMQGGLQDLGVLLQTVQTKEQSTLESKVKYTSSESAFLVSSSVHWMPYSIQFYSPEVRVWAERMREGADVRLEEALDWLRGAFSAGPNYERLLWMAYLFGAWGRWRLAEMYCDVALSEKGPDPKPSSHECLFFRALSRRRQARTAADYKQAERLLDEAWEAKATEDQTHEVEDPRFLRERGILGLRWLETCQRSKASIPPEVSPPPIQESLDLLHRALANVALDARLESLIHNDLCYCYLDRAGDDARARARQHCERLVEVQERLEQRRQHWPPNILDTVAIAQWRLLDRPPTEDDRRETIEMLETALSHEDTGNRDRTAIEQHLYEVRGSQGT